MGIKLQRQYLVVPRQIKQCFDAPERDLRREHITKHAHAFVRATTLCCDVTCRYRTFIAVWYLTA